MSEKQLRLHLDQMETALEEGETAPFEEARHSCLQFFKERIHPAIRARLWEEYLKLAQQGRAQQFKALGL